MYWNVNRPLIWKPQKRIWNFSTDFCSLFNSFFTVEKDLLLWVKARKKFQVIAREICLLFCCFWSIFRLWLMVLHSDLTIPFPFQLKLLAFFFSVSHESWIYLFFIVKLCQWTLCLKIKLLLCLPSNIYMSMSMTVDSRTRLKNKIQNIDKHFRMSSKQKSPLEKKWYFNHISQWK